ncbi:MAG: hypothetical protein IPN53_23615 [Comamonadaceae bacterium]|nr:hypothetical protein [Comamonadaceae bacterium]
MNTICRIALLGSMTALLSACATMGLDKKATQVDWSKGSVVVTSVDLKNEYKPNYSPTWLAIGIEKAKGEASTGGGTAWETVANGQTSAILTQQLLPGKYSIKSLQGRAGQFPVIGSMSFSVDAPFEVPPKSVIYLGHIALTNKEKLNRDDQASGAALPLIDQAVTGFGNGTLQVTLKDRYEQDVAALKNDYPALRDMPVIRAPLALMELDRSSGSSAPKVIVKP